MAQNNVDVNQDPTQVLKQLMAARMALLGPYQKGVNKKLEEAGAAHVEEALQGGVDPREIQSQAGLDHPVVDGQQQQSQQPPQPQAPQMSQMQQPQQQSQMQQSIPQQKGNILQRLFDALPGGQERQIDRASSIQKVNNSAGLDTEANIEKMSKLNGIIDQKLPGYQVTQSADGNFIVHPKAGGALAQINPEELDSIAGGLIDGSVVPSQLPRSQKNQVIAAALAKDPNYSPAQADMEFAANKAGATSFEKNFNNLDSFHKDFELNSDYLLNLSDDYLRSSVPLVNKAILSGDTNITGNPKATKFLQALNTVANGYARLQNPTLSGQALSDAARKEAQDLLPKMSTSGQVKALLDPKQGSMRIDANNRIDAAQKVRDRLSNTYKKGSTDNKVGKYTYE